MPDKEWIWYCPVCNQLKLVDNHHLQKLFEEGVYCWQGFADNEDHKHIYIGVL